MNIESSILDGTMVAFGCALAVFAGYFFSDPHGSKLLFRTISATLFASLGFATVILFYTVFE